MSLDILFTSCAQGFILACVAFAICISYRYLNLQDLTPEGSYTLGGALCAVAIINSVPLSIAMLVASLIAGTLGLITGILHLRLRINTLLAGIIISTMAYSVDLRVLGKSNVALFNVPTLFSAMNQLQIILLLFGLIAIICTTFYAFLNTEKGLRLRAVGFNPIFATTQSISVNQYTLSGLYLSNCIAGLAGCLQVQFQQYMDINMGRGIVIHALAALMIGESVIGTQTLRRQLSAPIMGAVIYQQIQACALSIGLQAADLNFFTGLIVISILILQGRKHHG